MFKSIIIIFAIFLSVNAQTDSDFANAIIAVANQWGQLTPEQWAQLYHNYSLSGDLNHIWHGLNEHCSSNIECGATACCLKPNISGKRAIIGDGSINFSSYCAKLRVAGETCSNYDINQHYYNFHCPCASGLKCVAGSSVQLHPGLIIPTKSTCQ